MVKMTMIARANDGLLLAASAEDETTERDVASYKQQTKAIFKSLSENNQPEAKCSVTTQGDYTFHYLVEFGVCYLCLCNKAYPKKLAFAYLEELQKEFHEAHGAEVETAARPYAFMKFDNFIQKTKKQYQDTRSKKNISKLNDELQDVASIMTQSIQEIMERGGKLDKMTEMSGQLSAESKKYLKDTKMLNWQIMYRKYGPPLIVLFVILFVIYLRLWWF